MANEKTQQHSYVAINPINEFVKASVNRKNEIFENCQMWSYKFYTNFFHKSCYCNISFCCKFEANLGLITLNNS